MPFAERVHLDQNRVWYIGDYPGQCVMVPVDQIEGMTAADIGQQVRELAQMIALLCAHNLAEYVLEQNGFSQDSITYYLERLLPHANQDPVIDRAIEQLQQAQADIQRYEERKALAGLGPLVYVLEGNGLYKIGKSRRADKRLGALQCGQPFKTQLVCAIPNDDIHQLEKQLHARFAHKRVNGEWFDLSPDDIEQLKAMAVEARQKCGGDREYEYGPHQD